MCIRDRFRIQSFIDELKDTDETRRAVDIHFNLTIDQLLEAEHRDFFDALDPLPFISSDNSCMRVNTSGHEHIESLLLNAAFGSFVAVSYTHLTLPTNREV